MAASPAAPASAPRVLIVSLGSTTGLRAADEDLAASLGRAGAEVRIARAAAPGEVRTLMLTDLRWARAARAAARAALAAGPPPQAIVYSTTTAALLWPAPGAIRFDAPAAANRPGRHGLWQRPVERRRLARAPLLLPLSEGAARELPAGLGDLEGRTVVLALPVEPSGPRAPARDITAITYAANPRKKGLDRVLAAWERLRAGGGLPEGAELVVAGAGEQELRRAGVEPAGAPGVRAVGRLAAGDYRALLRRARVFVCAPRREDYGAAQLEALADGCLLATTVSPGPYVALPLAQALDPRLVAAGDADLPGALAAALSHPDPDGYAAAALAALEPFRNAAVDRRVAEQVLPRLLGRGGGAA